MMMAKHDDDDLARWQRLTDKQRACLDLLIQGHSSKEIARMLDISKWTADQRIAAARSIFAAPDRRTVAREYARLKRIYDSIAYDPVQVSPAPVLMPSDFPDGDPSPVLKLSDSGAPRFETEVGAQGLFPPFQDGWRHNYGIQARIVIMVAILAALVIIVFLGLGIAEALTRLVSS